MKRALPFWLTAVCLLLVFSASAQAGGPRSTQQSKEPIIVGMAIGLTGFMAAFDGPSATGAQIKINEINAAGGLLGRKIRVVKADSKSDIPANGVAGLEVLEKGADLVLTSGDYDFGGPAAREASKRKTLVFSLGAASPKFGVQGIGPYAFTMATATPTQATIMAEWGYIVKRFRTAYILRDTTGEYTNTLCDNFKKRFAELAGAGSIVGEDTFKNPDPSFAAQVTRLKSLSKKPDAIYICSFPPGEASLLRQMRGAGIKTPVLSGEAADGAYWLNAVPNLSELYFPSTASIFGDDPDPRVNDFFKKFTRLTGKQANNALALHGYGTIEAWAAAVTKAGTTDGTAVKRALEQLRNVPFLDGLTTFTSTRHINLARPMRIMEVQGGKNAYVTLWRPRKPPTPPEFR